MENTFYAQLGNLPPLLNPDTEFPRFDQRGHYKQNYEEFVNLDWVKLLDQHQLYIHLLELFYYPPSGKLSSSDIHIDGSPADRGKINFIVGGPKSLMNWYKPKLEKQGDKTTIGTSRVSYLKSEVDIVYSYPVTDLVLVQVGIPHNIINLGEERWCFSLVVIDKLTDKQATFARLYKALIK